MKFKAIVILFFEADSPGMAQEQVANMMEELQDNHEHAESGEPWLDDWAPADDNWIQKA